MQAATVTLWRCVLALYSPASRCALEREHTHACGIPAPCHRPTHFAPGVGDWGFLAAILPMCFKLKIQDTKQRR